MFKTKGVIRWFCKRFKFHFKFVLSGYVYGEKYENIVICKYMKITILIFHNLSIFIHFDVKIFYNL